MNVLIFVTQLYQLSGAEKLAVELAKRLADRGYDVDLLSLYSDTLPGAKEAEAMLKTKGIKNVFYLGLPIGPRFWDIFTGVFKTRRYLKRKKYKLVESSFMGPITMLCWARLGLPNDILAGIHAIFDLDSHNTMKHRLWRYSVRLTSKIKFYGVSNAVNSAWCEYANVPKTSIKHIPNSIEDKFFATPSDANALRRELNIPVSRRLILFVGSLLSYKGVDTLINAIGPRLVPNDLHILFVGESGKFDGLMPGEPNFYQEFEATIDSSMWSGRASLLGPREDVARIMASCDLLVHPARTEGFGLVLAEALACGLPIVASDVGGIPEVLFGTSSIQVPANDPELLGRAIDKMLSMDPAKKARCIELGKQRAVSFEAAQRIDSILAYVGLPKK